MLEVRTSRAIVLVPQREHVLVFNFLAKSAFTCSHEIFWLLTRLSDWVSDADLAAALPGLRPQSVRCELGKLIDLHAVVAKGDAYAAIEDLYLRSWEWGIPAALLHFSLRDNPCISGEVAVQRQLSRAGHDPSPPLCLTHVTGGQSVALPEDPAIRDVLSLMARRRTNRTSAGTAIGAAQLAACLFAGLGIVGEVVTETGRLPLSMTPSGGARNPYEAYVYALDVDGLAPGFYHYAAAGGSFARVGNSDMPSPSTLLGGQGWTDAMPCIVFLVAHFERTMWKYSDANGYRVVLIEAGHIAQNIMLAATAQALTACPTAALDHTRIEQALGLAPHPAQAPIYAVTLSRPAGRCLHLPVGEMVSGRQRM